MGRQHVLKAVTPALITSTLAATPLDIPRWDRALWDHPDREWVTHIITGLQHGFRIGLRANPKTHSSAGNSPSATEHAEVVTAFLDEQISQGFMIGPFPPEACANVQVARLAVVPKKTAGKFRVVINLSAPESASVNDNLHRSLTHVAYSSIEDAVLLMHHLGRSCLMAKVDIRNAYRLLPVHPNDRGYLGIKWQDQVFVDCQLPFGLASSPAIFSAVAEALEWILHSRGVRCCIHYLDDFLILGAPGSNECAEALRITRETCTELGVPLALDKVEGPTTQITFLGIELNSTKLTVGLSVQKMAELQRLLTQWSKLKCVRDAQKFQSLIGHLVHATKVVPLGKAFLNRLFPIAQHLGPGQTRRLNQEARADISWWLTLCQSWSGIGTQQFLLLQEPSHHLHTDASGSWGCGAWSTPNWFALSWQGLPHLESIALKELFPIILASALWGTEWRGRYILCHSDNQAVVSQVNHLHARDPLAAHLLRFLAFFQARFDFRMRAVHIQGVLNRGADDLSRNRAQRFLTNHPSVSPLPTQVTQPLLDILLFHRLQDWTSPQWRDLCSSFWQQA